MKRTTKPAPLTTATPSKPAATELPPNPLRSLSETQQRIAELLADALINGAHSDDINSIVHAALRHERRRFNPRWADVKGEGNTPGSIAKQLTPGIVTDLIREWPAEPTPMDVPAPASVMDAIRLNIRRECRDSFERFISRSEGLDDVQFLNSVLANYEMELGEAFAYFLDRSQTYVKVPHRHRHRIEQFARLLENPDAA